MLRWVLQTVRVAGGCDGVSKLRTAFRSSRHRAVASAARPSHFLTRPADQCTFSLTDDGVNTSTSREECDNSFATAMTAVDASPTAFGSSMDSLFIPPQPLHDGPHIRSMAKLHAFLSEEQDAPYPYTIRDIRHRYLLWKSNRVLHNLSPIDLSSLIRLLGTLSTSQPGKPVGLLHTHSRAAHMPPSSFVPHWNLLATVFRDKRYMLRYSLLPSDRYWMMRAHLAAFLERVQSNPAEAEGYLVKAGKLYRTLSVHSHPDIHVPYLQALLASTSVESAQALKNSFASLLARGWCHSAVGEVLFQAVLHPRPWSLASSRQDILHALAQGIEARADRHPRLAGDITAQASTNTEGVPVPSVPRSDVGTLAMSLEGAGFGFGSAHGRTTVDSRIFRWSNTVASRVFSAVSEETVDLRWNCLVLLALARTRSADAVGKSVAKAQDPVQQAAVVEWQTVCILATLENLLQTRKDSGAVPFDHDILHGLAQVVRSVWRDWTTVHPSVAPTRSLFVTRLVCAAFFKLAGLLNDKALVDVCREYTVAAELWTMDLAGPRTEDGLQAMAAEQLYASLVCGTFFERALVNLVVYASHVRTIRGAVDVAVLRYARTDPEHAQELVAWSSARNIAPTPAVIATVGVKLARRGIGEYLDRYLNDIRLPPELREQVLSAHLWMYIRQGRRFMNPSQVVDAMHLAFVLLSELEGPIRLTLRLQSTLLVLIRHQYCKTALKLVEDAAVQHPSLFTPAFYTSLLRTFLHHRRYTLARRTLAHAVLKHPDMAPRWTSLILFHLHRAGARRLASKVEQTPSFTTLGASVESRRRRLTVSALACPGVTADDPRAWLHNINVLTRTGRMRAAKELFHAVRERASPPVRTSLGNAILHGHLLHARSTNRQRLRTVVAAFVELTERYAFAADHVTVNILFKAQLRSRTEVDAAGARRLFDALVRRGYPTGSPLAAPPFGAATPSTSLRIGGLEVPPVDAPLSFKRHVEPMYKTFVKVFYLKGDVAAARKVVGMLKTLEAQAWGR